MNKKQLKRLLKETKEHYARMIDFAETQDPEHIISSVLMSDNIGEDWFASSCPFCNKFKNKECPLGIFDLSDYKDCVNPMHLCCDGWWRNLNSSPNWGIFISRAKKLIIWIENIVNQYIKNGERQ